MKKNIELSLFRKIVAGAIAIVLETLLLLLMFYICREWHAEPGHRQPRQLSGLPLHHRVVDGREDRVAAAASPHLSPM